LSCSVPPSSDFLRKVSRFPPPKSFAWHSLCCDVTSSLSFVISKSEEGGTEHDKCVPSASLMPQDYQEFNYLDSLEEVDTEQEKYV
jgi:hypothetical protein